MKYKTIMNQSSGSVFDPYHDDDCQWIVH